MDTPTLILIIIGAAALAAAVVVPIVIHRKANPKRELQYRVNIVPLMRSVRPLGEGLKITYSGTEIVDPHVLEVSLSSTGRVDIRRDDFDGGNHLEFSLGDTKGVIDVGPSTDVYRMEGNRLLFSPNLVARGKSNYIATLLCSGKPTIRLVEPHPLANTKVQGMRQLNDILESSWVTGSVKIP